MQHLSNALFTGTLVSTTNELVQRSQAPTMPPYSVCSPVLGQHLIPHFVLSINLFSPFFQKSIRSELLNVTSFTESRMLPRFPQRRFTLEFCSQGNPHLAPDSPETI